MSKAYTFEYLNLLVESNKTSIRSFVKQEPLQSRLLKMNLDWYQMILKNPTIPFKECEIFMNEYRPALIAFAFDRLEDFSEFIKFEITDIDKTQVLSCGEYIPYSSSELEYTRAVSLRIYKFIDLFLIKLLNNWEYCSIDLDFSMFINNIKAFLLDKDGNISETVMISRSLFSIICKHYKLDEMIYLDEKSNDRFDFYKIKLDRDISLDVGFIKLESELLTIDSRDLFDKYFLICGKPDIIELNNNLIDMTFYDNFFDIKLEVRYNTNLSVFSIKGVSDEYKTNEIIINEWNQE